MVPLEITVKNKDASENIIVRKEIRTIEYGSPAKNILLYRGIPVKYFRGNLISKMYFQGNLGNLF
jgi:hypothetical protein